MRKSRNSTVELLRIISMLMILGLHYIAPTVGGGLNTSHPGNQTLLRIAESFCIPSVNVFVLISGYYLVSRRTTGLRKAVELYLVMVLLDLALLLLGALLGFCALDRRNLLIALVPFAYGQHWFLETYILLLLFLPFLNLLIERLSKQAHTLLICLQLLVFSVWPSFLPSDPLADNGYGLTNFITMYLIGAWLRNYALFPKTRKARLLAALAWLLSTGLIIVSNRIPYLQSRCWRYCYLFAISAAAALFLLFLNLPETRSRTVNLISGACFDVYIAHAFLLIQPFVYETVMQIPRFRELPVMPLHFLLCILLQFAAFTLLGLLRQALWNPSLGRLLGSSRLLKAEQAWEERAFSSPSSDPPERSGNS